MPTREKTVLITGCSPNSLGSAFAVEFASRNHQVIATARSLSRLSHLSKEANIQCHELDVTDSSSIQTLRSKILKLDILINNAGSLYIAAPLIECDIDKFKQIYETNVFGTLAMVQAFSPLLIEAKGILVNHGSVLGVMNVAFCGPYATSKAALAHLSDTLRVELAPFGVSVMHLITSEVKAGMAPAVTGIDHKLPDNTRYELVRKEVEHCVSGVDKLSLKQDVKIFAKRVVDDIQRQNGPPNWSWRGNMATPVWVFGVVDALWKGSLDWTLARRLGLNLLQGRLLEKEKATV